MKAKLHTRPPREPTAPQERQPKRAALRPGERSGEGADSALPFLEQARSAQLKPKSRDEADAPRPSPPKSGERGR